MLQGDRNASLSTRASVFCPSSPKTGPHHTDKGVRCVLGGTGCGRGQKGRLEPGTSGLAFFLSRQEVT